MSKTYLIVKGSFIAHPEAVASLCHYFCRNTDINRVTTITKIKHDMRECDQCQRLLKKAK